MRFLIKKKWNIAYRICGSGKGLLAEQIMESRGLIEKGVSEDFLEPELRVFHDPFLLNDMDKAVETIIDGISENCRILVFGDYDADGITSTAILCHYLRSLGADVSYMIPERLTEGYGLSDDSTVRITEVDPDIIITVDNGIASIDEIRKLMESGIKVIVTDHHECKETLPVAVAVINPKRKDSTYPFRDLSGAGVALKLVQAISNDLGDPDAWHRYLDVCTLGTVADMVSLTDENRMIVFHGLKRMNSEGHPGISALLRASTYKETDKITSATLGFAIAPRINAAGRVGDSSHAVELLLETDVTSCDILAAKLCADNTKRQEIESGIFSEAKKMIDERYDPSTSEAIIMYNKEWHLGVLGIVASKLAEYSRRTVFVFGGENAIYKGSVRSGDGLPVLDAITYASGFVDKFGGHARAAGLTVKDEDMDGFIEAVRKFSREHFENEQIIPEIDVDFEIPYSMVTTENAMSIDSLEPFGEGNRQPLFFSSGLGLGSIIPLSEGRHSKLILTGENGFTVEGLAFGVSPSSLPFGEGDPVDVVFTMRVNEWRGSTNVQLIIKDFRRTCRDPGNEIQDAKIEEVYQNDPDSLPGIVGEPDSQDFISNLPSGDDYFRIFRILKDNFAGDDVLCDMSVLRDIIIAGTDIEASVFKINRIFDVFGETGLIEMNRHPGGLVRFKLADSSRKVSLTESSVYRMLCSIRPVCRPEK